MVDMPRAPVRVEARREKRSAARQAGMVTRKMTRAEMPEARKAEVGLGRPAAAKSVGA